MLPSLASLDTREVALINDNNQDGSYLLQREDFSMPKAGRKIKRLVPRTQSDSELSQDSTIYDSVGSIQKSFKQKKAELFEKPQNTQTQQVEHLAGNDTEASMITSRTEKITTSRSNKERKKRSNSNERSQKRSCSKEGHSESKKVRQRQRSNSKDGDKGK